MARQSTTITTLPRSPEDDRRSRMIKYSVMMAIRMVCFGLALFAQGWWLLIFIVGAVFLPYVAVILANAVDARVGQMERPSFAPRELEMLAHDDPDDVPSP